MRSSIYLLLLLLVGCASNKSVDMVLLPEGKLYAEPEVVYKDEHNTVGSCRIWH